MYPEHTSTWYSVMEISKWGHLDWWHSCCRFLGFWFCFFFQLVVWLLFGICVVFNKWYIYFFFWYLVSYSCHYLRVDAPSKVMYVIVHYITLAEDLISLWKRIVCLSDVPELQSADELSLRLPLHLYETCNMLLLNCNPF